MSNIPQNNNGQATMANSQPIAIANDQSTLPITATDTISSGTLGALSQTVVLSTVGQSSASVKITGTWVGTIIFEGSTNGTTWDSINAVAASTSQPQPTTTVNGLYRLTPGGLMQIRVIMSAYTSGTATISMRASLASAGTFFNQIAPTKITDGTNTASIKPASTASVATDLPLIVALHPSSSTPNFTTAQPVTGTFFQATQPVSGTITSNVGTTGGLALEATQTNGNAKARMLDSTGTAIDGLNSGTGLNALNVAFTGTNYVPSTNNSTVAQLASLATFTGVIDNTFNQQAISILITSDQPGVITIKQYIDAGGTRKVPDIVIPHPAGGFSRSITLNGNYTNLTYKNTGFATTTTLRIDTAFGTIPATTSLGNSQVSLDEINGTAITARPDGFLRVSADPTGLLYDTFESLDTTNTWIVGGTVSPTGSAGNLSVTPSTTANASSFARSIPVFLPSSSGYLQMASLIQIEAGVVTGNQRFWGLGVYVTPTVTVPVTNGSIFEIDSATGSLFASTYSNSVRTNTSQIVRPTDGLFHRYAIYYKASRVYFEVDNVQVASIAFPNPQIAALATVIGSVNGATVVASSPVLNATLIGLSDTANNASKLSDGTFAWRTATVKQASTAALSTDAPLVVALHPNSPTPNFLAAQPVTGTFFQGTQPVSLATNTPVIAAGTNTIGAVNQQAITKSVQGTTGVTTQDLKDAGRSSRTITLDSFNVAAVAETLMTMSFSSDNGTLTTGSSYTVTAGKRFRLQSILVSSHTITGNTTIAGCIVRVRVNNAGAALISSPVQFIQTIYGTASVNQSSINAAILIPDGWEFPSGAGIAFTVSCAGFVATTAAPKVNITAIGYEY